MSSSKLHLFTSFTNLYEINNSIHIYQFAFEYLYFFFHMWLWFRIWTKMLVDRRIWRTKGKERRICSLSVPQCTASHKGNWNSWCQCLSIYCLYPTWEIMSVISSLLLSVVKHKLKFLWLAVNIDSLSVTFCLYFPRYLQFLIVNCM